MDFYLQGICIATDSQINTPHPSALLQERGYDSFHDRGLIELKNKQVKIGF